MSTYRLLIHQKDRYLGHFESSTPWSLEAVTTIAASLQKLEEYRLEVLVACDERRILENTSEGTRLICIEPLFKPFPLNEF